MISDDTAREAFVCELDKALQCLYNPAALRKSPLLRLFAVAGSHDPLSALQRILTGAVRSLKPGDNVPLHADAWRVYHVLTYRYVEQLSQKEVATDLSLGIRQLRRQEKKAVAVLADYLLAHYDLDLKAGDLSAAPFQAQAEGGTALPGLEAPPDRDNELAWLKESLPSEIANVTKLIETALKTIAPLTRSAGVQIECAIPADLPPATGQWTSMRQALLNLLAAAIHSAPGGQVQLAVETGSDSVCVRVWAGADQVAPCLVNREVAEKLEMTRQLVALFGGTLKVLPVKGKGQTFAAALVFRLAEQMSVLVIDDNADTLRLLERYLSGTRYRFTGTRDPQQALALAEELAPQIIVMDVMLPNVDGWELLGRLREHPKTRAIPVIACTILPQEQLALALGAAGFLRKPISREAFLSALDRQVDLLLKESH